MRNSVKYATFVALSLSLLVPQAVLAEVSSEVHVESSGSDSNVSVHQQSSSQTTVCHNGNCTTTGGENKSTVCNNGDCKTYDSDVNYKSEDGKTEIKIDTNAKADDEDEDDIIGSITPNPTIQKKIEKAREKVEKAKEKIKQRIKNHDSELSIWLKKLFDDIFNRK